MSGSGDLFRARLNQIIGMKHVLVGLAREIDWDWPAACHAKRSAAPRNGNQHQWQFQESHDPVKRLVYSRTEFSGGTLPRTPSTSSRLSPGALLRRHLVDFYSAVDKYP